ncbi:MAG: glycosyltransferase [Lachnospiraceae bacterium]
MDTKQKMTMEILISAVNKEVEFLPKEMNLECNAIIVNQSNKNKIDDIFHKDYNIKAYTLKEKGVGLSRNTALQRATADIILFGDDDIVYDDGYCDLILQAFENNPDADVLLFNMEVEEERKTYFTTKKKQVHWYNCGRYPTYSFAMRREKIHKKNITFSLLFGGGAKYSNGEDSLFLQECLKKGLKIYALPICIGREISRPSTWFSGYTEKFFYDRGILYRYLYGMLATLLAIRFLAAHGKKMCNDISRKEAFKLMKKGIKDAK